MGCSNTRTKVTILACKYFPVKNPYLLHISSYPAASLGLYNFNSNKYQDQPLKIPKLYPGSTFCWVDSDQLVIGGGVLQTTIEILEIYVVNIITLQVTRLPDMTTSHADFSLIYHKGEVFAISGYNYKNLLSPIVEKYSLASGWKTCKSLKIARCHFAVVSYTEKIFVFGGNSGYKQESITGVIEEYDSRNDVWRVIKLVMPLPLMRVGWCKTSEEKIMFFGGQTPNGPVFITFELDLAELKYTEKAPLPQIKQGWLFEFQGKYFKNALYAIPTEGQVALTWENENWRIKQLSSPFINKQI